MERPLAVTSYSVSTVCFGTRVACPSVTGLFETDASRHVAPRRSLVTQPRYLGGLVVDGLGWASTVVALRYVC